MKRPALAALQANARNTAARLRLLSNPARVLMLARLEQGEASVRELVELSGLSQSSVSQHLALLRSAGIVTFRCQAQTHFYSLQDPKVRELIHAVGSL